MFWVLHDDAVELSCAITHTGTETESDTRRLDWILEVGDAVSHSVTQCECLSLTPRPESRLRNCTSYGTATAFHVKFGDDVCNITDTQLKRTSTIPHRKQRKVHRRSQ